MLKATLAPKEGLREEGTERTDGQAHSGLDEHVTRLGATRPLAVRLRIRSDRRPHRPLVRLDEGEEDALQEEVAEPIFFNITINIGYPHRVYSTFLLLFDSFSL